MHYKLDAAISIMLEQNYHSVPSVVREINCHFHMTHKGEYHIIIKNSRHQISAPA